MSGFAKIMMIANGFMLAVFFTVLSLNSGSDHVECFYHLDRTINYRLSRGLLDQNERVIISHFLKYYPSRNRLFDVLIWNADHELELNSHTLTILYESVPETTESERYEYLYSFYELECVPENPNHKTFFNSLRYIDQLDGIVDFHFDANFANDLLDRSLEQRQHASTFVINKREVGVWQWMPEFFQIKEEQIPQKWIVEINKQKTDQKKFIKILDLVYDELSYKEEIIGDFHQLPLETLILKTGDCEDFSILVCALCKYFKIKNVNYVCGLVTNDLDLFGHAWVEYRGEFFEPTSADHKFSFKTLKILIRKIDLSGESF